MAAPSNDNRSSALLVPVGAYFGTVLDGTTIDATEDAGGPVDGFGAKDVFYYWTGLPAGNVYIYIQPRPAYGPLGSDTYFEAATVSESPTSWVSADTWSGFGSGGSGSGTCRFQTWHTGGDLSLVVYTYDPDVFQFDIGWGHDLDADSAHWSTDQTDSFVSRSDVTTSLLRTLRGVKQTYTTPTPGTGVPPESLGTCAFDNARDGVVDIPSSTTYGCSYIGPGPGTTTSGLDDLPQSVGSYYRAEGVASIPPAPTTTGRSDRVGVEQSILAWHYTSDHRGPITDETAHQPDGFSAYRAANEGPDAELVWGWDFTGASPAWDTQNYYLGDFDLSNALTGGGYDVQDMPTVLLQALDASIEYADPFTVENAADQVYTHYSGGVATLDSGYITAAEAAMGATVSTLTDLATTSVTIATGTTAESYLVESAADADGNRWLVGLFVAAQTISDTPPTFGDPPRAGGFLTVGNRTLAVSGTPTFESRLPTWRAFIGFPIQAQSTWNIGWMGPSRS